MGPLCRAFPALVRLASHQREEPPPQALRKHRDNLWGFCSPLVPWFWAMNSPLPPDPFGALPLEPPSGSFPEPGQTSSSSFSCRAHPICGQGLPPLSSVGHGQSVGCSPEDPACPGEALVGWHRNTGSGSRDDQAGPEGPGIEGPGPGRPRNRPALGSPLACGHRAQWLGQATGAQREPLAARESARLCGRRTGRGIRHGDLEVPRK